MSKKTKAPVFVLTAEIDGGGGDYDGTTSVHATRQGALDRFHEWLDRNGIDHEEAHLDDTDIENFIGGDPEVMWDDKMAVINWGINTREVKA